MLVLSRQTGESVYVGENITFRILKVNGKRVTLGIEAPHSVRVTRSKNGHHVGLRLYEGGTVVGYLRMDPDEAEEAGRRHESKGGGCRYEIDAKGAMG